MNARHPKIDKTRQGKTREDKRRQDKTRQDKTMFYLESYTDLYKYECVIWEMGGGGAQFPPVLFS